jgi:Kef-type K+ transport system membrane component KefB
VSSFLHIVITLSILLFAAKLFAELFHRIKMPIVLGELLVGVIVGPFSLGGIIPIFNGEPLLFLMKLSGI